MDDRRFDDLTRAFAGGTPGGLSRRHLLRSLAAGALGLGVGLGPRRNAAGACPPDQIMGAGRRCVCRTTGRPATDGVCPCPSGQKRCGSGTACVANAACCTDAECAGLTDQCGLGICERKTGRCGRAPVGEGTPCATNDRCAVGAACDGAGVCRSSGAKTCASAGDACHDGVCDPATGNCRSQPKPDGTGCDDGDPCTTGDACLAGRCVGTPAVCDDGLACTVSTCGPDGACLHPVAAGWCLIDGSCVAAGAPEPGNLCRVCDPARSGLGWSDAPRGTACADADRCDGEEACDGAGACAAGVPVSCAPPSACQEAGVCDSATGTCQYALRAAGTPCRPAAGACDQPATCDGDSPTCPPNRILLGQECDDGDRCTTGDVCRADGSCAGTPVVCTALDQCHVAGTCDPATGACSDPNAADGASCSDGDACTSGERCQAGVCTGATPVSCPSGSLCDPQTGQCVAAGAVCSPTLTCPAGQLCCGPDQCYDPATGLICASTCDINLVRPVPFAGSCPPIASLLMSGLCSRDVGGISEVESCQVGPATCISGNCLDFQVVCPYKSSLVDGVCTFTCGAGTVCPDGWPCCQNSGVCCDPVNQRCSPSPPMCIDICPNQRDKCGGVCCTANQQCIGDVCEDNCGGTTCSPGKLCCAGISACCDAATQVCCDALTEGCPIPGCIPKPTCTATEVYVPALNVCCAQANACGDPATACCTAGQTCIQGQCFRLG